MGVEQVNEGIAQESSLASYSTNVMLCDYPLVQRTFRARRAPFARYRDKKR